MAFNAQQIFPADLDASIAIGVNIPFSTNAVFESNYTTKDAIKNNIINYFLTERGERFLNPNFGGGLRKFLFEQITNNNLDFLQETINNDLVRYFPNLIINELNILKQEDNNFINIVLNYSIRNTNIEDTIDIEFT
jgi:phage baseplate assembly protein W